MHSSVTGWGHYAGQIMRCAYVAGKIFLGRFILPWKATASDILAKAKQ